MSAPSWVVGVLVVASRAIDLLALAQADRGASLPPLWTSREVRGQALPTSSVTDSAGVRFLRVRGSGTAGWFLRRVGGSVPSGPATLAFTWRVLTPPLGADLRAKATDDSALRIFVVFESRRRFERIPRTLFYSAGQLEPQDYARASFSSAALHVIRLGPSVLSRDWVSSTLDPFADYQRIWGEPPRGVVAVGIMQDTDQTRSTAVADIRTLSWSPRNANP